MGDHPVTDRDGLGVVGARMGEEDTCHANTPDDIQPQLASAPGPNEEDKSIKNKIKEGDNFAIGLWARNKFGWDRPGQTMTFRVPDQNGDIGDDNKIILNW
jgi:hypothetical protein